MSYSIIIPHYNIPDLLQRCLLSIPETEDFQVIVVDDCSPCAKTMINDYPKLKRKNVEFVFLEKNGGGGKARNEGLKYAKGEWVIFADADDFFSANLMNLLKNYEKSDLDIIYYNIDSVLSSNVNEKALRNLSKQKLFDEYIAKKDVSIFKYHYPEPWGKMIRRSLIVENNILFDETRIANDYFFSVQCDYYAKKIEADSRCLYVLTYRDGSVASGFAPTIEKLCTRFDVYLRVQSFLAERGVFLKPMPIRGIMVLLLKRAPLLFVKKLYVARKKGVALTHLFVQMVKKG